MVFIAGADTSFCVSKLCWSQQGSYYNSVTDKEYYVITSPGKRIRHSDQIS